MRRESTACLDDRRNWRPLQADTCVAAVHQRWTAAFLCYFRLEANSQPCLTSDLSIRSKVACRRASVERSGGVHVVRHGEGCVVSYAGHYVHDIEGRMACGTALSVVSRLHAKMRAS